MDIKRMLFAMLIVAGLGGWVQAWTFTPAKMEGKTMMMVISPTAHKKKTVVQPAPKPAEKQEGQ